MKIVVPIRSKRLRDAMMAFLDKEFREWPTVIGLPRSISYYGPATDVSRHRCHIGFDHMGNQCEREYLIAIIKWIAIKIGRVVPCGRPYVTLDDEHIVLAVDDAAFDPKSSVVDRWGVPIEVPGVHKIKGVWDRRATLIAFEGYDAFPNIRSEIQRLNNLWWKRL